MPSDQSVYKARVLLAVWGESFIKNFLEFSLPSLLAPGNLPALAGEYPLTFVFLTRPSDIIVFEETPAFQKLKAICSVEFISIKDLIVFGNYSTTLTYAFDRAIKQTGAEMLNTYFIFLTSDYIMANGSMQGLMRYIKKGYSGICAGNFQVIEEEIEPLLRAHIDPVEHVMNIAPRDLVEYSMQYLHPVTLASLCDQNLIHNYRANRFFVSSNQTTIAGRFYLLHMLCIKPEIMDYKIGSSCDYSFIPEMCPSGNVGVITDSDDYLVVELQSREHELDSVAWGQYEQKKLVRALAEWTTVQHRENAKQTIYYHSQDLTAVDCDAINKKLDTFLSAVNKDLLRNTPQPFYNHPYWMGASRGFDEFSQFLATQDDCNFINISEIHKYTFPRRLFNRVFGTPPNVFAWHYRWHEYRSLNAKLIQHIKPRDKQSVLVLYGAYILVFMRYRAWLRSFKKLTHHYFLPELLRSRNKLRELQEKKFDCCIIFEKLDKLSRSRMVLNILPDILSEHGKVVLVIPNENRLHSSITYDMLREFVRNFNALVNTKLKVIDVKPIWNNYSMLGAVVIDKINRNFSYSKKIRFLMYVLVGIPGCVITIIRNGFMWLLGGKNTKGYCSNIVVTLVPEKP